MINFTANAATSPWTGNCVAGPDADVATIQGLQCLLGNLLGIIAPLIAIAAVITIIFAGIKMILGADNPKEVDEAKKILTFAIIGVIGIAASWIIIVLIQEFTGAPVTQFQIITNP